MHPVRVHTLDVQAATILLDGQHLQRLERIETTPYGLHYTNMIPNHPQLIQVEAHVLPALSAVVSWFTRRERTESHLYIDMASIKAGPAHWTIRDLYLDVTIRSDGIPQLLDSDEYAAAILEGHLTPAEVTHAALSAQRVVNGLFAHGNDLEAWLASVGVQLDWWTPF